MGYPFLPPSNSVPVVLRVWSFTCLSLKLKPSTLTPSNTPRILKPSFSLSLACKVFSILGSYAQSRTWGAVSLRGHCGLGVSGVRGFGFAALGFRVSVSCLGFKAWGLSLGA